jgi:hypothetical protein
MTTDSICDLSVVRRGEYECRIKLALKIFAFDPWSIIDLRSCFPILACQFIGNQCDCVKREIHEGDRCG